MSKIILALTLVLGFLLNSALQEVSDYTWIQEYEVCKHGIGLTDIDLAEPDIGPFLDAVIRECVEENSTKMKILNTLLYRPHFTR